MPKVGMEPIRRSALVTATIEEIGAAGHLGVTVGQIAKRAGMSSALAHHYFGGKDQIFLAAMRHILREFGQVVLVRLREARTPYARAEAIVGACFAPSCFAPATISAWMTLYARAQTNDGTARLLRLYQLRLHSNLTHALRPLTDTPDVAATTMASLIDGLYLRAALARTSDANHAHETALNTLKTIVGPKNDQT